jgi:hypothetical protein
VPAKQFSAIGVPPMFAGVKDDLLHTTPDGCGVINAAAAGRDDGSARRPARRAD